MLGLVSQCELPEHAVDMSVVGTARDPHARSLRVCQGLPPARTSLRATRRMGDARATYFGQGVRCGNSDPEQAQSWVSPPNFEFRFRAGLLKSCPLFGPDMGG